MVTGLGWSRDVDGHGTWMATDLDAAGSGNCLVGQCVTVYPGITCNNRIPFTGPDPPANKAIQFISSIQVVTSIHSAGPDPPGLLGSHSRPYAAHLRAEPWVRPEPWPGPAVASALRGQCGPRRVSAWHWPAAWGLLALRVRTG